VVICSDEFGPLGRAESEVLGLAGMPLVPIPHPLADNKPDLVAAKASGIVDDVIAALIGDAEAIGAQHAQRFVRLTQRRLEGGAVCVDDVCAIDFALDPSAAPGR